MAYAPYSNRLGVTVAKGPGSNSPGSFNACMFSENPPSRPLVNRGEGSSPY